MKLLGPVVFVLANLTLSGCQLEEPLEPESEAYRLSPDDAEDAEGGDDTGGIGSCGCAELLLGPVDGLPCGGSGPLPGPTESVETLEENCFEVEAPYCDAQYGCTKTKTHCECVEGIAEFGIGIATWRCTPIGDPYVEPCREDPW